ncbi:MAG: outer membrane protein transport protein [Gammaproteobacteria bacterium]
MPSSFLIRRTLTQLSLASCFAFACSGVQAAGFRLPEQSIAGLGLSNALVANPDLPGALPYNPAVMAFQEGLHFSAGLLAVDPNLRVTNATGNPSSDVDSPIVIPNLNLMGHLNTSWSWGLSVIAPFGLETRWADESFPGFAGTLDPLEPAYSKVEMVNVNPNIAYRFNESTSVALGVDYYRVNKAVLDTQSIKMRGDGADWGWNIGLLHKAGPWSFGAAYRSSVEVGIEGGLSATALGSTASIAKTKVKFPEIWQVGARYQATEQLAVEADIERTGWSSFDTPASRTPAPA